VSPRWRSETTVLVAPERVALRQSARGLRPAPALAAELAVSGAERHWEAPLEALEALLAGAPARGGDATVVVSSHFVHYCLVPPSELLVTREDEVRFAQQNFVRIHGAAAEGWSVRVGAGAPGGAALGSGIEQALVDALRALLARHGLRPRALQPALMALFNRARGELPAAACRVVALEPGMAVSAVLAPGWRDLRSQRLVGPLGEALERLLARESALEDEDTAGIETCVLPLLPFADAPALGESVRVLDPWWSDAAAPEAGEREAA